MSEMGSFYGGRAGAPFILVKSFDGIDIPQTTGNYTYKRAWVEGKTEIGDDGKTLVNYVYKYTTKDEVAQAIGLANSSDLDQYAISPYIAVGNGFFLLKKTADTYSTGRNWVSITLDNSTANYYRITETGREEKNTFKLPQSEQKLAEGMVQFFSRGAETSSEVNYGEYVLIDTVDGLANYNSPENGRIFKRGLDFNNGYAGGEFVGQISGPQGDSPTLIFGNYELEAPKKGEFALDTSTNANTTAPQLVSGKNLSTIKWSVTDVKEPNTDRIFQALIGLQIPYKVDEFKATSISPYTNRQGEGVGSVYTDLIEPVDNTDEDGNILPDNPFYKKWNIKVPQGYHGADVIGIEIVYRKLKTVAEGYPSGVNFAGSSLSTGLGTDSTGFNWSNTHLYKGGITGWFESYTPYNFWNTSPGGNTVVSNITTWSNYFGASYNDTNIATSAYLRCVIKNYDSRQEGKYCYAYIGELRQVDNVSLSDAGVMSIHYSDAGAQALTQKLRWINNVQLTNDGIFTVTYNTKSIVNNREVNDAYTATLRWVKDLEITEDGKVNAIFNNNTKSSNPLATFKTIKNIAIDTTTNDSEYIGDQKIHITYNTKDATGQNEVAVIGKPLNYIVESTIYDISKVATGVSLDGVKYGGHLIVYFSDPEFRKQMAIQQAKKAGDANPDVNYFQYFIHYPSTFEVAGIVPTPVWRTQWIDMGQVKGESGEGFKSLMMVENISQLRNPTYNEYGWGLDKYRDLPPETLTLNTGEVATYAKGWYITVPKPNATIEGEVEYYAYDYNIGEYYKVPNVGSGTAAARSVVVMSPARADGTPNSADVASLNAYGLWFGTEIVKEVR